VAIDRHLWQPTFDEGLPNWPCPTCGRGTLHVSEETKYEFDRGACVNAIEQAVRVSTYPARFMCTSVCSNAKECGEIAIISGNLHEPNIYVPLMINPPLRPIFLPQSVPTVVSDAILSASMLYWSSLSASANMIRRATEGLIRHRLGMSEIEDGASMSRGPSLHQLIKRFSKNDRPNGRLLMAVKWIGNSGSHIGNIPRDDVLDAFDMLEMVAENIYSDRISNLMGRVEELFLLSLSPAELKEYTDV
jgi:hypothetical protein